MIAYGIRTQMLYGPLIALPLVESKNNVKSLGSQQADLENRHCMSDSREEESTDAYTKMLKKGNRGSF